MCWTVIPCHKGYPIPPDFPACPHVKKRGFWTCPWLYGVQSLKNNDHKNECVSYITACYKTETPNSNVFH